MKRIAAFLLAGVSLAAWGEPDPRSSGKPAEARPDDVICTYQTEAGSHLKKRVCATRKARDAKAAADQALVKRFQQQNGGAAAQ